MEDSVFDVPNKSFSTFDDLLGLLSTYIHNEDSLQMIKRAWNLASELHKDQKRKSGEPYIIHPLNVACILAELHVGPATICAGILHDVVEDTPITKEELEKLFNHDIAEMVDGVTKVGQLQFASLEQKQAENHQHILLAMARDIRVIIIKLADRLHNMRTLEFMKPEKQVRIAQETLEIYAPLAHKLGMFRIKAELEDTALRYTEPVVAKKIMAAIESNDSARLKNVDHTIDEISDLMRESNLVNFKIKGRIKSLYSIYKKMETSHKDFEEIYDILAVRIIVDSDERIEIQKKLNGKEASAEQKDRLESIKRGLIGECYQILGLIHSHYTPLAKRFKDYIAVPKPNMYQSLHTTVISEDGFTFEVQIRTQEMDDIAELGVAAHWAYKEGAVYSKEKEQFDIAAKLKWYGDLLKFSEEERSNDANEYVESAKVDLLSLNVYVYTPTGEVVDLPRGSTPLDFAYRIHTNVGNQTVGAIVNNHIVPLDYKLETGDIVSIKTNKNSFGPSETWLKIAYTQNAKHKIKSFLNKQNRDVLIAHGKELAQEEFKNAKLSLDEVNDDFVKENFTKNNASCLDELFLEIAKGNISAKTVISKLQGTSDALKATEESITRQIERNQRILTTNSDTGVVVEGLKNPQLKLGSCCNPIPGDEIIGYVTKGNGIVVHHAGCHNLVSFQKERFITLDWATNPGRKYPVAIKVEAQSNINLIVEIMNTVSASNMSILAINAIQQSNLTTVVKLKVMTTNLLELDKMIINLKKVKFIYNIERENI